MKKGEILSKFEEKNIFRFVWVLKKSYLNFRLFSGHRQLQIDRLPHPYGDCKLTVTDGIEDDIYHQNFNVTYSLQVRNH